MAKSHNKTVETDADVAAFIERVEPPQRREDARVLLALFERVTGEPAKMWGPSIIGFGSYHYIYDSGREGDAPRTGFSPRKANLVLYLSGGYCDPVAGSEQDKKLQRLGKHRTGKSCLYLNKLTDVDMAVLEEVIADSVEAMARMYPR